MCCTLKQIKPALWDVFYQNNKVGEISPWKGSLVYHYGMGSAKLAACEVEFIRDWVKDQIVVLNLTRRLMK